MTRESRKEQSRPERVPVSENRNVLSVKGLDPNFYHRWVNDVDNALQVYLDAGYQFVTKDGGPVGDPTVETSQGTDSRFRKGVGGGITAFLMRLPMELWKEDQARKEADIRETERAMRQLQQNTGHRHSQEADYGKLDISRS